MGAWMDQQLKVGESFVPKSSEIDTSTENQSNPSGEDANSPDYDLHSEVNSEMSDAASLEQRRAYKIELQVEYYLTCKMVGLFLLHYYL